MSNLLFHAINGVGVGHIARLSWIASACRQVEPSLGLAVISPSIHSAEFFGLEPILVPSDWKEPVKHADAVIAYVLETRPSTVIFDTRWPPGVIDAVRRTGGRTALVLRAVNRTRIEEVIAKAHEAFDLVIVPHTEDELTAYYDELPGVMNALRQSPFTIVGPIARVSREPVTARQVILTLGGGGAYPGLTSLADSIGHMVTVFAEVGRSLLAHQDLDVMFLRGPLMAADVSLPGIRTLDRCDAYKLLGPRTCVVSRGGYNTCWEAVGAGATLVLSSTYESTESVMGRCDYLAGRGLALVTDGIARAIVTAVESALAGRVPRPRSVEVNAGLTRVARSLVDLSLGMSL